MRAPARPLPVRARDFVVCATRAILLTAACARYPGAVALPRAVAATALVRSCLSCLAACPAPTTSTWPSSPSRPSATRRWCVHRAEDAAPRRPLLASLGVHPPPHGLCRCAAQSVPPARPLPPILQSHPLPCSLCACTAVGRRLPPAGATARPTPSGLLATLGAGRAHAGGGSPPYISLHLPISPRSST